jgi:hypothetical protein
MASRRGLFSALLFLMVAALGALGVLHFRRNQHPGPVSEAIAFAQTYLNSAEGRTNSPARSCAECHADDIYDPAIWKFLKTRSKAGRAQWAAAIALGPRCGSCHVLPDPATLPGQSWDQVISRMDEIMKTRKVPSYSKAEWQDLRHFYFTYSRETQPPLPPDPTLETAPIRFDRMSLGNAIGARERPWICHVKPVDLDRDGHPDLLVCDTDKSQVNWLHPVNGDWIEQTLAGAPFPDHVEVFTNRENGRMDIVVACQTIMSPTDDLVGSVVLLENDGALHFTPKTILDRVSRVADVEPADVNGDGKVDFLVAAYGYITEGEIGWLEQTTTGYNWHSILKRSGAINILPVNLNGEGKTDFVVLFAQEHEMICAYLNEGNGSFREKVLFQAATPSFGSSGIQLVDLDGDGDVDILYTNGDNMDLQTMTPRAFHGVQWLENKGNLEFEWHNIRRFYGAYSAVAADLNGDGKLDIAVTSMFNDWNDPGRASLIWLENDGKQNFRAHGIARTPIHLINCAVADLDGDGRQDIVAGVMNAFAPFDTERMGRITLWKNRAAIGRLSGESRKSQSQ